MKIFRMLVFGIILCLTFTSCSKTNTNKSSINSTTVINKVSSTGESIENVQDYNKLFELNLYSDKQEYKITDKIKIWATLKYIGNNGQIRIWHALPYISFSITDGKTFKTGDLFNTVLTSTVLVKGKLYKFNYAKSGGYSADDPNADFWKKFYQEKNLYLPKGEYTVKVGGAFSIFEDTEKSNSNLVKEIKIKIED
jgi:hypothetical protein